MLVTRFTLFVVFGRFFFENEVKKLTWTSLLASILTGTAHWNIVDSFICRATCASCEVTSFYSTNKIKRSCLLSSWSLLGVCIVSITIGTGLEMYGTTFHSAGKISLTNLSMKDVQRRTGTARFQTTPKSTHTRQSPISTCKVIMPRTRMDSLVALIESGV